MLPTRLSLLSLLFFFLVPAVPVEAQAPDLTGT